MSIYNHFADKKYPSICFGALNEGDKFRMNKWSGKRRRMDIQMIKTGDLTYMELKSKKKYSLFSSAFDVSEFNLH